MTVDPVADVREAVARTRADVGYRPINEPAETLPQRTYRLECEAAVREESSERACYVRCRAALAKLMAGGYGKPRPATGDTSKP